MAGNVKERNMIEKCQGKPSQSPGWMVCQLCRHSWEESDPNHQCWRAAQLEKGGHKDDADKVRVDLVDPEFVLEVAKVLSFGAEKYEPYNWMRGMAWSRPFAALLRHLLAWQRGEEKDPETGLSHLAHAAVNVMFLMNFQRNKLGEDDRGFKG